MSISHHILIGGLALLGTAATAQTAGSPAASALDDQIATYNAHPDTERPLAIGRGAGNVFVLPLWVRDLPLSKPESAALVALAGAYTPRAVGSTASGPRYPSVPEYLAAALLAGTAIDKRNRLRGAYPNQTPLDGRPDDACCTSQNVPPRPKPPVYRPPAERFARLIPALESCPAAFASLAIKLHSAYPDSDLDLQARRARSDNLTFATKPETSCPN